MSTSAARARHLSRRRTRTADLKLKLEPSEGSAAGELLELEASTNAGELLEDSTDELLELEADSTDAGDMLELEASAAGELLELEAFDSARRARYSRVR